jgi:hypothetical protein
MNRSYLHRLTERTRKNNQYDFHGQKTKPLLSSDTLFLGSLLGIGCRRAVAVADMQELIGMQFRRFSTTLHRVLSEAVREVGVVRGLLVLLGLLVFRRLFVMVGRVLMVTSRAMVVMGPSR